MDLDLFTVHHKEDRNLAVMRKHFTPIQVGCATSAIDLRVKRDDELGTISHKNSNYCELTAFDEIVRSSKAEHIGVMHYRRIFTEPKPFREILANFRYKSRVMKRRLGLTHRPVEKHFTLKLKSLSALDTEARKLNNFLERNIAYTDIFTPVGVNYYNKTLREYYQSAHIVEHFDQFIACLIKVRPEIKQFISSQDQYPAAYYLGNMFIMRRHIFQEYWAILYEALSLLEEQIDLTDLDPYQARVFGFLAERFMGVFCRFYSSQRPIVWRELPMAFCE